MPLHKIDDEFVELGRGTAVKSLEYDFFHYTGNLFQPEGACCDMGTVIALFQRIDTRVIYIRTWSGDKLDTQYYRGPRAKNWKVKGPSDFAYRRS
jgi:hypothetical protein